MWSRVVVTRLPSVPGAVIVMADLAAWLAVRSTARQVILAAK